MKIKPSTIYVNKFYYLCHHPGKLRQKKVMHKESHHDTAIVILVQGVDQNFSRTRVGRHNITQLE